MAYDIEIVRETNPEAIREMLLSGSDVSPTLALQVLVGTDPGAALDLAAELLLDDSAREANSAGAALALRYMPASNAERIALRALARPTGPVSALARSIGWIGSREALPALMERAINVDENERRALLNAARLVAFRTGVEEMPAPLRVATRRTANADWADLEPRTVPDGLERASVPPSLSLVPGRASAFDWRGRPMAAVPIADAPPVFKGERPARAALLLALLVPGNSCTDGGVPYLRYLVGIQPEQDDDAVLLAHDGQPVLSGTMQVRDRNAELQLHSVEAARGPLVAARMSLDGEGGLQSLQLAFDEDRIRTARPIE